MERTELRDAFFAEVRQDPFAHMAAHLAARMWAEGYEQALRDNGLPRDKPFSDRMGDALEHITDARREHDAKLLIALAETGSLSAKLLRR